MDKEFWEEEKEESVNVAAILLLFVAIAMQIITFFLIIKVEANNKRIENKISELEKSNNEVHEYILNRIGG